MLDSLSIFEEKNKNSKKISKQNEKFKFKQIEKIFNSIMLFVFFLFFEFIFKTKNSIKSSNCRLKIHFNLLSNVIYI